MAETPVPPDDVLDAHLLLGVLAEVKAGNFTARMPLQWTGVAGKVADGLNDVIMANQALEVELARISRVVGHEGRLSQRAVLGGSTQSWSGSVESVNDLIEALVRPTSEMQRVIGAVADGDLSKKVTVAVSGEMLERKNTINAMVDQLNGFISEVTRVVCEVGSDGKLGQAAAVTIEVGGVWKDLTDNVNLMAANLTGQVRNIAEVTTAVANGDLSKKISIDVKGEFLELKNTVNAMVDQLNAFAREVTRVAREVGSEGKLGGQAQSTEVSGVWKGLTDDVNQLAANLTNQVRAIAEVATAVTKGDLTRRVRVEASGEVGALKDTLNEMIRNLGETTRQNVEQEWLNTNRERFTRTLQGQDNLAAFSSMILSELATLVSAQQGVFYSATRPTDGTEPVLELQAGYGNEDRRAIPASFRLGEGLIGQCGKDKKRILLSDVPGDYMRISSGLGASPPLNVIVLPVVFEGSLRAVVELASFSSFSAKHQTFLDSIMENIGILLSTIEASALTESLLRQSQSLAEELRLQQVELRQSNEGLERQASLLAERNREASNRNQDIEQSKRLLEEKAAQLAISSKYKSEFIANISHELRTPLNSLLILSEQLEANPDHNLTDTQVQYASVINASGKELMSLLNSVLDLAKVESGTITAELTNLSVRELRTALLHEFEPVAQQRYLAYAIDLAPCSPETIVTDPRRLRQILKNLLVNAFKFTEHGTVHVQIGLTDSGWSTDNESLANAPSVLAVSVSDTGIGINDEQQQRIFEAFAQGDGTTARLYGGTGLGLSISRELASLLGGEITVASTPGHGSTFTIYLPTAGPATSEPTVLTGVLTALAAHALPAATSLPFPDRDGVEPEVRGLNEIREATIDGMKILVVDDDFRNIFALSALLERAHAHVTLSESGAEALATLKRGPVFDAVLMDIMMPVMDGYEAIRAIRTMDQFRTLPIIAVTGSVTHGERQRCLDAGASDYLPKPINSADLLAALRPWMPGTKPSTSVTQRAAPPTWTTRHLSLPVTSAHGGATPDGLGPDRLRFVGGTAGAIEGLRVLVVDDDIRNSFALSALLERSGTEVVVAESGAEALATLQRMPRFDVVLVDIMMPVVDGYDAIRAIRRLDHFETLPIIAMSAKMIEDVRDRCLDAGANDYVRKPADTAELLATLRPWMSKTTQSTMA